MNMKAFIPHADLTLIEVAQVARRFAGLLVLNAELAEASRCT